jgi:phosphatidylglycerol lysyltransferase
MLRQRTQTGLWITALLTGAVGVANLLSAVTPSLPERLDWLEQIFPFEVRAGAHLFAVLSGFFLLILSANLLRRKRLAWLLTIGLLIVSIISNLLKGWDYEESLLSTILLGQLLLMGKVFTARSDRPSIIHGIQALVIALLFTLAYGTLGFLWLDRHYSVDFSLSQALRQTLTMFFTVGNAEVVSNTRFERFFADSIYIIGAVTLLYALWMLLRPVLIHQEATTEERKRAKKIIEQYGRSSLARFALLDDKSYHFSSSGRSVIAYVPEGRSAIALGDPIGPVEERLEAIATFKQFCDRNDWQPAFYQTLAGDLKLYESLGFKTLKIGEEAVVDLPNFTLQGKAGRHLRSTVHKFNKLGYYVQFYAPPITEDLLAELRAISNEWRSLMKGSEKKFSLGWFNDEYLKDCEIAVVCNAQANPIAFANVIPEYQLNEITIDLMRHLPQAETGTMDYLLISLFERFKRLDYDSFNLGLVALSGVGAISSASRLERGIHYLYQHLDQFYNFQGLRAYKDKFNPDWESRYLVYPRLATLPDVVVGLIRADSGDRLWDYLGTQFLSTAVTSFGKKLARLAPLFLSVLLFGISLWAITQELRKYHLQDILHILTMIPRQYIALAIALTLLNYLLFTGYDTLAVYHLRQPLSYRRTALVAIVSYAISNSVGFALLSGSAIRYRFYSAWGLSAAKIAQIIAFCNLSFWLGFFAVGGVIFALQPIATPESLHIPFESVRPVGYIFLGIIAAYLLWSGLSQKPLKIKKLVFPHLPIKLSLVQIALTSLDWMLAAAILYVLLPVPKNLSYFNFFGIYLLGQLAGIISNVPGGLGVFESVLILLLSPVISVDQLLGVLLAYRGIYYFLPLGISMLMLGLYELRQQSLRLLP